jgi:hypothetical protein
VNPTIATVFAVNLVLVTTFIITVGLLRRRFAKP